MKHIFLHIVLVVFIGSGVFAQTTFVPDTNLRKVLKSSQPSCFDANDQIVDAKAAAYIGYLNCSGQNVKDLTGLWKFTGLTSLVCQNNAITHLDSLAKFTNLLNIYCFHNKISRLPELASLNKLSYLSCGSNLLTAMPNLGSNTAITYLDCGNNLITNLKGIEKLVNLQTLYVYNNKLDSLSDLSSFSKLQMLMCQGNNLRKLRGLGQLTQLTQLVVGNNKLDSLPDLSALTKLSIFSAYSCLFKTMPKVSTMSSLKHLILNDNQISTVTDLSGNPVLSSLELSHNQISILPDISACKNTLKILKLQNNQLHTLPDLSTFASLDTVFVHNNQLTFENVIPLAQSSSIVNVKYAPQDSVSYPHHMIIPERKPFILVLGIDKNIADNQYIWYKNGQYFATTRTDTLLIPQVQFADSGIYSCQISNALAPLLTLHSHKITLKVKPCIDVSRLSYTTKDFDCNVGGMVSVSAISISGGQQPYTFKLKGNELGFHHYSNAAVFMNLFETSYTLEIQDLTGCSVYYNAITVKGKRDTDCKRLVIVADDNSPNNTLYLEERGTATVFDTEGQFVQSFNTPSAWDGRNKNGEFLPGYYIIELNGKILNVTLIK